MSQEEKPWNKGEERVQYALLIVRIRSKPQEHSFFIDYAKYSNFFILINLGTYMRSILNFIHHRKNGNTDVLADWNKYLIFQDFLKCSEHSLCILVPFRSIAKYRDLKELLQTQISLLWQQAITEGTQIEQSPQQVAGEGNGKGRGSWLLPVCKCFNTLNLSLDLSCRVIRWDCRMFLATQHPEVTSWPFPRYIALSRILCSMHERGPKQIKA